MDWERLTSDVVAAASFSFQSLISEHPEERFYAFALYTDEYAETVEPSANSVEQFEAKVRARDATDESEVACYQWATAEWAYERRNADLFTSVYRDLANHRGTLSSSEADYASYKKSVHECMISALKQMDENGFFAKGRENITLFISSSDDDEAFDMENRSAQRLNPEPIYRSFLERYGDDDGSES